MRTFNNKEIELLAPAGNLSILKELIDTSCDAFYMGGKSFNMRMHRSNFNFSHDELKQAIEMIHERNKNVYVTVNNLMSDTEINSCLDYLYYLETLKPDALIIQDLGLVSLINSNKIKLPMHSSVMMNVHNEEMVKKLFSLGITRTVVSREISLETIAKWSKSTSMEFEYFIHGDMCAAHGSQCYYSNLVFGKSGNRGMCMKPCRWNYKIKHGGKLYDTSFPLAVKDMYMYESIPELISSGVCSFKIEGRMREAQYLTRIIQAYGNSIDRYIEDPIYYDREVDKQDLYENRMRDFSTAYAFKKPQMEFINQRYEGTGFFYSTGKVFSKPIEEHSITENKINKFINSIKDVPNKSINPLISVRVDTLEQLKVAINNNVDYIYINTENFNRHHGLSINTIKELSHIQKNSKLILALPKMTVDESFDKYDKILSSPDIADYLNGIMVSNIGALHRYKNISIPTYGDITFNIYNNNSKSFYKDLGMKNTPLSIEMKRDELADFANNNDDVGVEIVAHGSPTIMYLDLDLYLNLSNSSIIKDEDNIHFQNEMLMLVDDKGFEHPVLRDIFGRNHLLLYKDICLLPILKELINIGVNIFRLEISHYSITDFEKTIKAYYNGINNLNSITDIYNQFKPNNMNFSLGSLNF